MASNFMEHKSTAVWKRFFSVFLFSASETDLVRLRLSLSLEKVLVSDCILGCSVNSGEKREGCDGMKGYTLVLSGVGLFVFWEPYPSYHNGFFSPLLVLEISLRGPDQYRCYPNSTRLLTFSM